MNFTCPACGMDEAYFELVDSIGAHYCCPICDHEWVNTSITAEDEEEENFDEDEEEEEDDEFSAAQYVTYKSVSKFIGELIENSDTYNWPEKDLDTLKRMHEVVRKPGKYQVNGYLYIMVKENYSSNSHRFQEIKIDEDGLQLNMGGYESGPYGGDSFSEIVYPVEDGMKALGIVDTLESFLSEFSDSLTNSDSEIEVFDSGDEIDEN